MQEISLKNYMENCVSDKLPAVIKNMDICTCERCKMDILAYSLNQLPPKYVATPKGHIYTKLEAMQNQFDADIIIALTSAAKLVGDNPRHEL